MPICQAAVAYNTDKFTTSLRISYTQSTKIDTIVGHLKTRLVVVIANKCSYIQMM